MLEPMLHLLLGSKVACSYSWRCKWQHIHCWHNYSGCSFCWWGIFIFFYLF